ncbi:MAG: hypothetical protein IT379_21710 [Deltaproteobacteria bacterium]|nr:hypothetical protein [Deltaproteobacteria bacterium]
MTGSAKTVRGEVVKVGLAGHVWGIRQADGVIVELLSPPQDLLHEGIRVEVEGDSGDDRVSIGMMGDRIAVASWRRI